MSLATGQAKSAECQLGKLVQFEKGRRDSRHDRQRRSEGAEILIFTGVRYERQDPAAPTKPTTTSRAKRKRG